MSIPKQVRGLVGSNFVVKLIRRDDIFPQQRKDRPNCLQMTAEHDYYVCDTCNWQDICEAHHRDMMAEAELQARGYDIK